MVALLVTPNATGKAVFSLGCLPRTDKAVLSSPACPSGKELTSMPFHELRIVLRHLLKSPGLTTTALLMLALGIGATTAIFSIVEGVLLRPLPFPHPERLVAVSDM